MSVSNHTRSVLQHDTILPRGALIGAAILVGGALTLVNDAAAAVGGGLLDMALSKEGHFLYVRDGSGTVNAYRVGTDGTLTAAGSLPTGSLPAGAQGIVAR